MDYMCDPAFIFTVKDCFAPQGTQHEGFLGGAMTPCCPIMAICDGIMEPPIPPAWAKEWYDP
ncbi:hypothetical protein EYF80_001673 [Liparis tanakae]|uniref:Uncharacterized protein n=1 Tax=Liparis tanakae TaxID=230148 RepID=A0A4Z2JFQ2_9TELE|nr:hypothetical protein EYF80_001673 [Liparis tanakae]